MCVRVVACECVCGMWVGAMVRRGRGREGVCAGRVLLGASGWVRGLTDWRESMAECRKSTKTHSTHRTVVYITIAVWSHLYLGPGKEGAGGCGRVQERTWRYIRVHQGKARRVEGKCVVKL